MAKKFLVNTLFFIFIFIVPSTLSAIFCGQSSKLLINEFIQGQIQDTPNESQRKFILTGGPSVGKTSIIKCFQELGYVTFNEAAMNVIQESLANGITEPWFKDDFEDKIIELQQRDYQLAVDSKAHPIFFDRGPVDSLTYSLLLQKVPSKKQIFFIQKSIDQQLYDKTVFLIENLGFCRQEVYRVESNDQSLEIERALEANYQALGFKVIRIPSFPHLEEKEAIFERTKLILEYSGINLEF